MCTISSILLKPTILSYRGSGWAKLNIDKYFTQETDIEKIILVSNVFKDIEILSDKKPELAHAVFFDFKNHFFDKYPDYDGSTAILISEYEKIIRNQPNLIHPFFSNKQQGIIN
jgi:hypothetical protein